MKYFHIFYGWITSQSVFIQGLVGLITIAGFIFVFLKFGGRIASKIWSLCMYSRKENKLDYLKIIPQTNSQWWSFGTIGGRPAMQVVGDFYITNVSGGNLTLLKAYIDRPRSEGSVMTRHHASEMYGQYHIRPGGPIPIRVDFFIEPPVCKQGQFFKATVTLVDHYGHEHQIKNIMFRGPSKKE